MKLPKLMRAVSTISLRIFWFVMVAFFVLILVSAYLATADVPRIVSLLSNVLTGVMGGLMCLGFFLVFGGMVGSVFVDWVANTSVRISGKPATAIVLATNDTGLAVNRVSVTRLKLEVHPPDGKPFEAIVEDDMPGVDLLMAGEKVAVRYNPATKAVALEKPKPRKQEDF